MFNTLTFPETMEEFIEQYKVVKGENLYCDGVEFIPVFRMKEWVKRLQPRKGEWMYCRETGYGNPYGHFECSLCGDGYGYKSNFCPNCGADMRGEVNGQLSQQTGGN